MKLYIFFHKHEFEDFSEPIDCDLIVSAADKDQALELWQGWAEENVEEFTGVESIYWKEGTLPDAMYEIPTGVLEAKVLAWHSSDLQRIDDTRQHLKKEAALALGV